MTKILKKNSPIQAKVPGSWHFFGEILVNANPCKTEIKSHAASANARPCKSSAQTWYLPRKRFHERFLALFSGNLSECGLRLAGFGSKHILLRLSDLLSSLANILGYPGLQGLHNPSSPENGSFSNDFLMDLPKRPIWSEFLLGLARQMPRFGQRSRQAFTKQMPRGRCQALAEISSGLTQRAKFELSSYLVLSEC